MRTETVVPPKNSLITFLHRFISRAPYGQICADFLWNKKSYGDGGWRKIRELLSWQKEELICQLADPFPFARQDRMIY